MSALKDYEPIVTKTVMDELKMLGEKLSGKVIQNINSTAVGGGVAEILNRMIPLIGELGVDARWDVIKGGEDFFKVTKKFHNALHGAHVEMVPSDFEIFEEYTEMNIRQMELYGDVMFIHDPQPIGLVKKKKDRKAKWIWRCHIDFSAPDQSVWPFLKQYVEKFDASVFSAPSFAQNLSIPQFLVAPSIDPLSDKNKELPKRVINKIMEKYAIPQDKPIITQISRFDYLKDPFGVIEVFNQVKKYIDCRLVIAGGGATDDPEGEAVLNEIREKAGNDPDIHILVLPPTSNIEINAIQRASTVILQKSLKEGFGLTVAEALWKAKPVVASAVGGIPLQITHKFSGLLSRTVEGTAYCIKQLLHSPDYAKTLGKNGKEHIRQNFLLTRHLRDYMLLFLSLDYPRDEDVIHI
ncbi:MAG: glycosyltransferase [bacterium]